MPDYKEPGDELSVEVEITTSGESPRKIVVSGAVLIVGRSAQGSIVLKHDDVSRRHAQIEVSRAGMVVRDLSTNGTFVEGRRVNGAQKMAWGQRLKVGPFTLRFARAQGMPMNEPTVTEGPETASVPPAAARGSLRAAVAQVIGGYKQTHSGTFKLPARQLVSAPVAIPPPLPPPPSEPPALQPPKRRPTTPIIAVPPPAAPPAVIAPPPPPKPVRPAPYVPLPSEPTVLLSDDMATRTHGGRPAQTSTPVARTEMLPAVSAPVAVAVSNSADQDRDRLKRWLRGLLLEALDLPSLRPEELEDKALSPRVLQLMDELLDEHARELPHGLDRGRLRKELADEVLGLGPLEDLIADTSVSEVMVIDRATIYVERAGRLHLTGARFSSEDALRAAIERIVTPLGRRIDESTPMVDARLKDGSRVNAIIPPLALRGPCLTIRKFSTRKLLLPDLIGYGSLDARMAKFLTRAVIARRNILVSGGTGSGKTTLLNVLSSAIPDDERIITIEDAAELRLAQPHVVSLETRPANMEGRGEFSIRDLVKNALRMRPDRIVVGECRGGEALDMLQAMNTGHDGSLTTTHANSPEEAIARLETLVLMGGVDLPTRAIREQIAASIHVVVQQARFVDGSRKITSVAEVIGIDDDGTVRLENIFEFHRSASERGKVVGEFRATGYMPSFLGEFITMGLCADGDYL